jgi:hypothetical protein
MHTNELEHWVAYRSAELKELAPLLRKLGIVLDKQQPHLGGERHLTRPLESGRKLLLLGHRASDKKRVVIKASSDPGGMREIAHEHTCRSVLERISFAYQTFHLPEELLHVREGKYLISITAFIEQERPFLERPLREQFALALAAFKAQESAHATTYAHARTIRSTFGEMRAADYLAKLRTYREETKKLLADGAEGLARAEAFFAANLKTVEQYSGFLTHWDFMPQNFRIANGTVYLLDHSSLHFGNKHESWARFTNFMELYNPPLAQALVQYVRGNRTPEESLSLKLMRVYRLSELIRYYAGWLPRTEGDLNALALARLDFWREVLSAVLDDAVVLPSTVEKYKAVRDSLRSEEEKERQKGLH